MNAVFADSFHFLALLNGDDPAHERAVLAHRRKWRQIVTTDCILLEVGDALWAPGDRDDFLAFYHSLPVDPRIQLVRMTPALLTGGVELFRSRPDKDWPLTDCISFAVMAQNQLHDALTGDHHFEQAGFRALLKPTG